MKIAAKARRVCKSKDITTTDHHTHHHGTDKLGLAALLEAFANDQWIGEHYTEEQAVEAVMDRFKRLVEAELELMDVRVAEIHPNR